MSRKNLAARERVRSRPAPKPLVAEVRGKLFDVWKAAMEETFPDCPCTPWSRKVQGQSSHLAQAIEAAGSNAAEVLDWCVRSWETIRATTFRWMTQSPPPEVPNIGFLLKFTSNILEGYGKRDRLNRELRLTPLDRLVAQLRRSGLPYEQAREEAEARLNRGDTRQQNATMQADLARTARARDLAQAEAVRAAGRTRLQRERGPMRNAYDEAGGLPALPAGGFEDA